MNIEKHLRRVGIGILITPFIAALVMPLFVVYTVVRETWPVSGYYLAGAVMLIAVLYLLGWIAGADKL